MTLQEILGICDGNRGRSLAMLAVGGEADQAAKARVRKMDYCKACSQGV